MCRLLCLKNLIRVHQGRNLKVYSHSNKQANQQDDREQNGSRGQFQLTEVVGHLGHSGRRVAIPGAAGAAMRRTQVQKMVSVRSTNTLSHT